MDNPTLDLKDFVLDVPNFPKPGITFKDITPMLAYPHALDKLCYEMGRSIASLGDKNIDAVIGIESRGFILATLLARDLMCKLVLARKAGKLPRKTVSYDYALEYGHATLQLHEDSIGPSENVLIVDDLLATGGTAFAAGELVKKLNGNIVGYLFAIELSSLKGRQKLGNNVRSVLHYS